MLGCNSVRSGREADITKFLGLRCPFNQALICCYFPWYLVLRRMAKVEFRWSFSVSYGNGHFSSRLRSPDEKPRPGPRVRLFRWPP